MAIQNNKKTTMLVRIGLGVFFFFGIILPLLYFGMAQPAFSSEHHVDTTDPGFAESIIDYPGTDYAFWSRLSMDEKLLYIKAFTEGVGIQAIRPDFFEIARQNGDTLPEVFARLEAGYGSNRRNERTISVPWAIFLSQMRVEGRSAEQAEYIRKLIRGLLHPERMD